MDVDIEDVLRRFTVLGTSDKDALISQFQSLVGSEAKQFVCEFFLELANWNLQAALCAYYDTQAEASANEVKMTTVDHLEESGEISVPISTTFLKGWRIRNSGTSSWPTGCSLRFLSTNCLHFMNEASSSCSGDLPGRPDADVAMSTNAVARTPADRTAVPCVPPGCMFDLWVAFQSPPTTGIYQYELRICTSSGTLFGDSLHMLLKVADDARFDVGAMRASLIDAAQPHTQMPVDDPDVALAQHIGSLQLVEGYSQPHTTCIESLADALRQHNISYDSNNPKHDSTRSNDQHTTSWQHTGTNQPDDHAG